MSSNQITEIPDFLCNSNQLIFLDLSNNKIKIISPKILNLKLYYLNIQNNPIMNVPKVSWEVDE